jgi:hypothetical protein
MPLQGIRRTVPALASLPQRQLAAGTGMRGQLPIKLNRLAGIGFGGVGSAEVERIPHDVGGIQRRLQYNAARLAGLLKGLCEVGVERDSSVRFQRHELRREAGDDHAVATVSMWLTLSNACSNIKCSLGPSSPPTLSAWRPEHPLLVTWTMTLSPNGTQRLRAFLGTDEAMTEERVCPPSSCAG